jgi:hypothetical protein
MIEPHELRELTARLGVPQLEQITHRSGRGTKIAFYWDCGCTATGTPAESDERTAVRWLRCEHHVAAEEAAAG